MRPQAHVIGDVGQTAVALIFKKWGWTASLVQNDYGEDLDCHVFVDQQRTPFYFRCQVKSSSNAAKRVKRKKSGDFSVQIAGTVCREWLLAYFPVLLLVYDDSEDNVHWVNATDELRSRVTDLGTKSLTLSIPAANRLRNDRDAIAALLSRYYAQLLRVQSVGIERTIFPLLMPRYRVLSSYDEANPFQPILDDLMEIQQTYIHQDDLPAWTTGLKTLDGQWVHGLVFKASHGDVAPFSELLIQRLERASRKTQLAPSEWFSFVCDPLRYSLEREGEDTNATPLQRHLTNWTSYAYVGGAIVHDHDYAFRAPDDYVRQIGRRARSWDGYYYVSLARDLAVQLIAGICSSPGDKFRSHSLLDHANAQYLPWRCHILDVEKLRELLWRVELVFREMEDEDSSAESEWVSGAICTSMFDPGFGLIPQARNWRELEHGSAQARLATAGLLSCLPGEAGNEALVERLARTLPRIGQDPPTQWLVDGVNAREGLPLDLSERRVIVQRMRGANSDVYEPKGCIDQLKLNLLSLEVSEGEIETSLAYVNGAFNRIAVLTAAWTPCLSNSSAASLERATPIIVKAFDEVLPRASEGGGLGTSMEVLQFEAELYFEGDRLY